MGLLVAAFGLWRAGELRINTQLTALVPEDYASVQRLDELRERVGSQTDFIVELRGPEREKVIAAGNHLTEQMKALPDAFIHVEFYRDTQWFRDHALLYVPVSKLLDLRDRIIQRIRNEVRAEVVEDLVGDETTEQAAQPSDDDSLDLDEASLRKRYGQRFDIPREYLEAEEITEQGNTWVFVIRGRPLKGTTNVRFTQRLVKRVQDLITGRKDENLVTATIRGHYAKRSGQADTMKKDVLGSTGYALVLLLIVLGIHFKRIRAIPLIIVPLLIGILGTLGIATLLYPWLNVVTAFIFVALLGLGIDFGIHVLSRYEYERLAGVEQKDALVLANTTTGVDVAMGALTTAVLFALLTVSDFRGFSQFGVVACIGVVISLVSTLTVLPAMIVVLERVRPWKPRRWLPSSRQTETTEPPRPPSSRARLVSVVVIVLSLVSMFWCLQKAPDIAFEYNFSNLEKKILETTEDPDHKDYTDAIQRPDLGPALILGTNAQEVAWADQQMRGFAELTDTQTAQLVQRTLTKAERRDGDKTDVNDIDAPGETDPCLPSELSSGEEDEDDEDPFANLLSLNDCFFARLKHATHRSKPTPAARRVIANYPNDMERIASMRRYRYKHLSVWSFVPDRQITKLWIIRDIRRRIDDKVEELTGDSQKKIQGFRKQLEVDQSVGINDLPQWVRDKWLDAQNKVGRHAIIYNRGSKMRYDVSKAIYNDFFDLPVSPPEQLDHAALQEATQPKAIQRATLPFEGQGKARSAAAFLHGLLAQGIIWGPKLQETLKAHIPMPDAATQSEACGDADAFYAPWNLERCLEDMPESWAFDEEAFLTDLRTRIQADETLSKRTLPVAASYFVMPDIIDTLRKDGPKVITIAFVSILICLLALFRNLGVVLLVLVPVVAAISWLAGVFWLLDWKVNLYNIITFALLVGMGVDDGIHITRRWLENGRRGVSTVVRETGAAITLTTITTCIGFGGLLFSNHIGLGTLGWTAALGMVLTFLASVTTLPALLTLCSRRTDSPTT